MNYLFIFIGGGLGAVLRFATASWVNKFFAIPFPWGTAAVNVIGSLMIGFILSFMENRLGEFVYWRELLVIGFLGGFTTFSSFSWETLALLRDGQILLGLGNVMLNLCVCLISVYIGFLLGK